ncbi:MAG TPA: 50S ribosomal protein L32 [Chitinophagaceae bacterium]|nr:50S ribosomal protein L32 [Chitinophagaceae bacterium]
MAHPKRRQSRQRTGTRRAHDALVGTTLSVDPTTGETHVRHRAHWSEGKLYYKGQVVLDNNPPIEADGE